MSSQSCSECTVKQAACTGLESATWLIAHSPEIAPDPPAIEQRDSSKVVRCNTVFISA
ncbi:MAG: hypothetical protein V9G98_04370 [Candidatus Competibacter sp.]